MTMSQFEYTLEILSGAKKLKQKITLPCVIGRGTHADFKAEDGSVSKQHAKILQQGDDVVVLDLKSANGTYVNGKRVEARVINSGDVISCASVQMRFMAIPLTQSVAAGTEPAVEAGTGVSSPQGYEKGVAPTSEAAASESKLNISERFLASFDKLFLPFYRKTFAAISFPKILIPLVIAVFVILVVLTLSPQLEQNQQTIRLEAQKRAILLAKRLIDINKTYLDQDKDHLLTVESIMDESEVVEAYIAKPDGKILAPERRFGQFVSSAVALRAVKSDSTYVETFGAFGIIASQPVYRFSQSKGKNEVYAVAVVMTSTRSSQLESSSMIVLWLQIILFIVVSGVLVSFLFIRIFTQPWRDIEEQIEHALQKEGGEIPLVMNFGPVKQATRAINAILFKAKEGASSAPQLSTPPAPEIVFLEVSELGEILTRHVPEKDSPWLHEKIENFESAPNLTELNSSLAEWFESLKSPLENQASASKEFSTIGMVVSCYRRETLYVMMFSRPAE